MSFHIVSIDSPQCSPSSRDGQLMCKMADGERKLPVEEWKVGGTLCTPPRSPQPCVVGM